MRKKYNKGVALVEILVAAAIIASSFVAVLGVYANLSSLSLQSLPKLQAAFLAEEGIEALHSMRDGGYSTNIGNLSSVPKYYLVYAQNTEAYGATTTTTIIDSRFYRTVQIEDVYRDGAYNIASSGTLDADTKKATVMVSWQNNNATSTHTLQTYVFNIFDN